MSLVGCRSCCNRRRSSVSRIYRVMMTCLVTMKTIEMLVIILTMASAVTDAFGSHQALRRPPSPGQLVLDRRSSTDLPGLRRRPSADLVGLRRPPSLNTTDRGRQSAADPASVERRVSADLAELRRRPSEDPADFRRRRSSVADLVDLKRSTSSNLVDLIAIRKLQRQASARSKIVRHFSQLEIILYFIF